MFVIYLVYIFKLSVLPPIHKLPVYQFAFRVNYKKKQIVLRTTDFLILDFYKNLLLRLKSANIKAKATFCKNN